MDHIKMNNLSYKYPNAVNSSLKNININIEKGEFVLVIGKSGSGKSTLAKVISGSIPNFYGGTLKGLLEIEGINCIDKIGDKDRRNVSMVFQDPEKQLIMNKVHREIAFGLENIGLETSDIHKRLWESLQFCSLLDFYNRDIKTLSGGEKQKVVIASALAMRDECIILDEPTSQLDPSSAEEIINLIKKINEELGVTIIVIEQRIERWLEFSDKVTFMKQGEIDFFGTPEDFLNTDNSSFMPSYIDALRYMSIKESPKTFKNARIIMEKQVGKKIKIEEMPNENKGYKEHKEKKTKSLVGKLFSKKEKEEGEITIRDLKVNYDDKSVLNNINLNIKKGDFCALIGPNGAGKSTFLKAIMNLIEYKGNIRFQNKNIKDLDKRGFYKNVGYVSQNPNDYISRDSVYNEIKFTLDNYNIKDEKKINKVIKRLNLEHLKDKNPRDISGGERQRLAIATMIVLEPKVLLIDEPTRGLDNENKKMLQDILKEINRLGVTIILITHDMDFAASSANRFIMLFNGKITSDGDMQKVFKEGFYYTTTLHKLFNNINKNIFNLEDVNTFYIEDLRRKL
ncbi:ABC transporter ATP-binding protein [Clostridium algidicarnis]|uniref:ATP-binding cassette domain-containing protein n=1 Tax=Clostridium algidicarnis TaxID=37659 RepID=A0ABS6C071_9CLOT|nr:energy-coupling factor transporter ATPase [Clostridium algidicarnis]MBB6631594.1 ABC transporter ATP-binding protein [Clostridium algidicarnis]MBU3195150.1 ATP-binding cassette domain-containing protein [Clostridium algidicarnis]MBU3206053.1 ATP-binding cassette domain-containing protein [Clostridium algidicarnis]MBU3218864.1 ATP-binding cassette domain-containing protein [Clostridium algidicarnis]MCB2286006.1 ATP-binding cassette domain-containing protein [Clostridium algidicarnis]